MTTIRGLFLGVSTLALVACGQPAPESADELAVDTPPPADAATPASETAAYPSQVYWGDTHLHTSDSADAFAYGARIGPEDALQFARGEQVTSTTGIAAQLSRPLDFLVIADHAVGLGVSREIYEGNPALIADPTVKRWHEMMQAGGMQSGLATREMIDGHAAGTNPDIMHNIEVMGGIARTVWSSRGEIVEQYNDPGDFTAFIGYEYTSTPGGDNLHRVVIFKDGIEKTNTIMPFSSGTSVNPEDLWAALAAYEENTGGSVLAIPHNSNLSNGKMFAFSDFEGNPLDADYASKRARWEPLVEITQIKGDSEAHPFMSPNDEFAGFGDAGWERGNLNMSGLKEDSMLPGDYVREALKRGLRIESETGHNPFKMGVIGSTDSHTGLATADEANFFGKHVGVEPNAKRAARIAQLGSNDVRIGWQYLSSGYAAVWATDNTREALFDAMMRKEVYATTGPRITLRFFGGYDFDGDDVAADDMVARGYSKGVPMGGDLPEGEGAPSFMLSALMDPESAHLDRMQIVKGWLDADGNTQEQVFDVVWSDDRAIGDDGKLPPVGDTVDLSVPTWSNTIGAAELKTTWSDPNFDPSQAAFYYVRAIEIPTPRWPAYDAVRFGADVPEDATLKAQERAYSSPIWYTPK